MSNIEAIQQTLNVTLDSAYLHVFVPVEALTWIRSIAIVLLIVAHAMRYVRIDKMIPNTVVSPEPITPKMELEAKTTISEDTQEAEHRTLALPQAKDDASTLPTAGKATPHTKRKNMANYERVKAYMDTHQSASVRDVAKTLDIGISTANKWIKVVKDEQTKESEQTA